MKCRFAFAILFFLQFLAISKAEEDFTPDREVVYKTIVDTELKLHLFTPEGVADGGGRTAVVFFFGGGWAKGSADQFYPHCAYLKSRGVVGISADYRVKSRDGTTPAECVMDAKSAIRWIRSNALKLGIDPDKIVAGGGSAGGHVAAAAATTELFNEGGEDTSVSAIPAALVLFNPVFDNGPMGYGHSRVKDYWKDISPMHNISKTTPPTIVFLGTKDALIPVKTAEQYKDRMSKYGGRCDLHFYDGQVHGFFNFKNQRYYKATVEKMDRFLVSLGFLSGEPSL